MDIESIEYKNYTVEITQCDSEFFNPRENCNLGVMVCCHRDYYLGDKIDGTYAGNQDSLLSKLYDLAGCDFEIEYDYTEHRDRIIKELEKVAVILPLYLYDHSGITMNTTGFSCGWDSGQVGYIVATKESIRKEYNIKRVSKKLENKVKEILRCEVSEYDDYLTGNIYEYSVMDDCGEYIDHCSGFMGYDHEKSGLMEYAKNAVDYAVKEAMQCPNP